MLSIHWIVPGLIIGGGGHRNILRAAYYLEKFGHRLTLHFIKTQESADEIRKLVQQHFYPIQADIHCYKGRFLTSFEKVPACDVIFATHWSTVDTALAVKSSVREIFYFVQDFEPAFTPMGSDYILAENTYRRGLYCISSGPWCAKFLRDQYGLEADHFLFALDKDIYFPRPRIKTNKNIVFFAKPEMPRRCYTLGVTALAEVYAARPDIEIIMFGSPEVRSQDVPFPVNCRNLVPTLDGLAEMYSSADLGIVFSTTNPSAVFCEMMACGLPVIDLRRPGNEINYGGRFDVAYLADPVPQNMAKEIIALIDNKAELEKRRQTGLAFAAGFPSEEQMARRIEELVVRRIWRADVGV